jgi:hypothetical protein
MLAEKLTELCPARVEKLKPKRKRRTTMERIKEILDKYTTDADAKSFEDTVEMLFKKGIPNGCYQDYRVLMDVMDILGICLHIIQVE